MSKLYQWYIILKYNYYKLYWKVHKPAKRYSGFYGWQEYDYNVLDQKAKACGVISYGL